MKKNLLMLSVCLGCALGAAPEQIDFDRITHWAGKGDHHAALVVQFDVPEEDSPGAIVWGYRWEDGTTPTSDAMMRAIAAAASDLVLLVQYTGPMGSTLDGIGYGPSVAAMLDNISFDYFSALDDPKISFDYLHPNTGMGQTSAPGQEAEYMASDAIAAAADTHVIEHPLNYAAYGYPAYDYDHWVMAPTDRSLWQAGWYKGYWSFWVGDGDTDNLSYSGMGMSSVEVSDGQVSAWKFKPISSDDPIDGTTGASTPWHKLNYDHFSGSSHAAAIATDACKPAVYYRLDGTVAATVQPGDTPALVPGLYIVRRGSSIRKIFVQ